MTQPPLFWLNRIEISLAALQEIPLWGPSPEFPWEKCSALIGKMLQIPDLTVERQETQILSKESILSPFGLSPLALPISLPPIKDSIYWIMSQEDIAKITQLVLSPDNNIKKFSSPRLQEGFYRFLALNVIRGIDKMRCFGSLSPRMAPDQPLPDASALCIDVCISHAKLTVFGRLCVPTPVLEQFRAHFTQKPAAFLNSTTAKQMDVELSLTIGHATLNASQMASLIPGNLLILDRCTYDPKTHKGAATVQLHQTPLFRARIKESNLKIVDYAYYYEEESTMQTEPPSESSEPEYKKEHNPDHSESEEDVVESEENHMWSEKPQASIEEMLHPDHVPLTVTVEVARLKMNLDKLLQLQLGNLIELPVRPEQGVYLTLNGAKIAKGELVKIGDTLGVKILQIGE